MFHYDTVRKILVTPSYVSAMTSYEHILPLRESIGYITSHHRRAKKLDFKFGT